jgi:hypothetical protein
MGVLYDSYGTQRNQNPRRDAVRGSSSRLEQMNGKRQKWFGTCPIVKEKKTDTDDQARRANPSPPDQALRINPYALYTYEELSPRSSGWLYISVVSIACLSSFLVTERAINEAREDPGVGRASINELVIILLSTSFVLSFLVVIFYQHRDLREKLTKCIGIGSYHYSAELFLALILFGMWCIILRYLTDRTSGLNYGLTMMTIDGEEEVWNINIWVCTWLGWGLASYLVGELIMAPPLKMGGVWMRGNITYPRHDRARIRDSTKLSSRADVADVNGLTHGREESSVASWFMLLSFSTCLAAFSIALCAGYEYVGDLRNTPFYKRLWLGAAIGLSCALLAFAALVLHRMEEIGSFDHWGSRRDIILSRADSALSVLSLVLLSINLGYGTGSSGPSTEMSNLYVTSSMGFVLSLILCERARSRSVERLFPSSPPSGSESIVKSSVRGVRGNDDDYDSSSSSSLPGSSNCPSSISSANQGSSRSPSSAKLTMHSSTDPENRDSTASSNPCRTRSPSPSDGIVLQSPFIDEESHDESGVNIILQPCDDVSSIGDSMMTQARMDPDGYKSDEVYTVSAVSNPASTRPSPSTISGGKYCAQSSTLSTIRDKNIHMKPSQTIQHSKQKIEEIMNREPEDRGSKSKGRKKFGQDTAESRLRRIAVSSPQALAGGDESDSTPTMANH